MSRRRYRCDCGRTVELEPRKLAPGVVTWDRPYCAEHPEWGEMVCVSMRAYPATAAGLDQFVRDHGPACPDLVCGHEHCAAVRELHAHDRRRIQGRP